MTITLEPIGVVRSDLTDLDAAPRQGDEGGATAWLEFDPHMAKALTGIEVGDVLVVLTWLHLAQRDVLQVHPRDDVARPLTGVFATRSSHRPNPIGLHEVTVLQVDLAHATLQVAPLEALDGTPIIDMKPVLTLLTTR